MDKSSASTFNGRFMKLCGILGLEKLFGDFKFPPHRQKGTKDKEKLWGVLVEALWDWDYKASKEGRTREKVGFNLRIPQESNNQEDGCRLGV